MGKGRQSSKKSPVVFQDAENEHPNTSRPESLDSPVQSVVSEPNTGWKSVKSITSAQRSPRRTPLGSLRVANSKTPEGREVFFTSVDSISPYAASPLESSPVRQPLEGLRGKALKRRSQRERRSREVYHDCIADISSVEIVEEEEEFPLNAYKRPLNPVKAGAVAIILGIAAFYYQYGERVTSLWHQRNTRVDQVTKLAHSNYEWAVEKTMPHIESVQSTLSLYKCPKISVSSSSGGGITVLIQQHQKLQIISLHLVRNRCLL